MLDDELVVRQSPGMTLTRSDLQRLGQDHREIAMHLQFIMMQHSSPPFSVQSPLHAFGAEPFSVSPGHPREADAFRVIPF